MRILYGVQGTGNGHLGRARCLANAFAESNVNVDYLFSGRAADRYFDMQTFGNVRYCNGLTFATSKHKLDRWKTLMANNPIRFVHEISQLKTTGYDLVITDYEPITAWSARRSGTPLLGIGHQYAFNSDAPKPHNDPLSTLLLKWFAPAPLSLGMHWHHFGGTVLPPMVDRTLNRSPSDDDFILVYLPFAETDAVKAVLLDVPEHKFVCFAPGAESSITEDNVTVHPVSRDVFKDHMSSAAKIICSAGFMLISEALHIGTPVMAVPLDGQIEQIGNAMALEQLELATIAHHINPSTIRDFANTWHAISPMHYPEVAAAVAEYCLHGDHTNPQALVDKLWQQVGETAQTANAPCPKNARNQVAERELVSR